jgi:hypothetical protein
MVPLLVAGLVGAGAWVPVGALASVSPGTRIYKGTIGSAGCGWKATLDLSADSVDLVLTDASNCAGVHLQAEVTGGFDGSATVADGPGSDVTLNSVSDISATVGGVSISTTPGQFQGTYNVGTNLQKASGQAAEAAVQGVASDALGYLGELVLEQSRGGPVGLDFNRSVEALMSAEQNYCSGLSGAAASGAGICADGNSDTGVLSATGDEGGDQQQACPQLLVPVPGFLVVCVPTFVAGDVTLGGQSLLVVPGGALIALPVGGNLSDLLAGPVVSSSTAIVSFGGVIAGDNLTFKAPVIEWAAGVAQMLGHLRLNGSTEVNIGSVDLNAIGGLSGALNKVIGLTSKWVNAVSGAGINDKGLVSLLSEASASVPMEVQAQAVSVTTPDFVLGSGSALSTQAEGGTAGESYKELGSPSPDNDVTGGGYRGGTDGGYGGLPDVNTDSTWEWWHSWTDRVPVYSDPFDPDEPGSGTPAEPGGGVITIDTAAGTATIDGDINADGFWEPDDPSFDYQCQWVTANADNDCSFGAGGSVDMKAGTLSGDGVISADGASPCRFAECGGDGGDGPGGGGRVALIYGDDTGWSGSVHAYGGWDQYAGRGSEDFYYQTGTGGAGTVFTRQVVFSSNGTISQGAGQFPGGTLTVDAGQTNGWYPAPLYYSPPDATPIAPGWGGAKRRLVVTNEALVWATTLNFAEIDVTDGSTITSPPREMYLNIGTPVLEVDATSHVSMDTRGYQGNGKHNDGGGSAPGAKGSGPGAGGSHGGLGGPNVWEKTKGGVTYDSSTDPSLPGGGGGGGASGNFSGNYDGNPGGGVLDLKVGTLQLDGTVSANGTDSMGPTATEEAVYDNNGAGGGAGGSVVVDATELLGAGTIAANGGLSCITGEPVQPTKIAPQFCNDNGAVGGGGGGRVAVYVGAECRWTGSVTANGGQDQYSTAQGQTKYNGQPGTVDVVNKQQSCPS